ncbi:MAG: aspartate/tyrosine/aromatic aminotransferase [Propionibacteriaceae bacterium]|jgi:aromatic-amino-acid transaminase|nr:aspartate/tyrosine/aromatic aminotransferase [Propionibacteriaceae bacterium]
MSLFASIEQAPADPILGITDAFKSDPSADKVNLGIGVYQDESGKLPLMDAVARAEAIIAETPKPRGYLPMDGIPEFTAATKELVFGPGNEAVASGRIVTLQSLAGTGALKIGADFLHRAFPAARILFSDPTWDNHSAIYAGAGFEIDYYPYYDRATGGVNFPGMLEGISAAAPGTVVLLHACCHNPSGCDLTPAQWAQVLDVVAEKQLVPFFDMAYQGFAVGPEEDPVGVRLAAERGLLFLVANSYSKTFGLYGERVGALSIGCTDATEAKRVLSRAKLSVRSNYSNPPTHGASIVSTVLSTPELRASWEAEVASYRDRIANMRHLLAEGLKANGVANTDFVTNQRGMFTFTGLSAEQMQTLRGEYHIYGVDNGRICVAAINTRNVEYVAQSLAKLLPR